MSAAVAVAAAVARSRRRIVARFRENGATAPDRSVSFHAVKPLDERVFQRLVKGGVLKLAGSEHYYLDVLALDASNKRRRLVVVVAMSVVLAATIVALWLTYR